LLKTAETQRIVAYAESSIIMNRLPNSLQRDLEGGDRAIGLILRDYNIPTIRHLESWGRVPAGHPATSHFKEADGDSNKNRPLFYRSYSIAANIPGEGNDATVPIMRVAEYFQFSLTPSKELAI
jgi:chorismate-pyruvate lyase